jgi:hypothetical protein
MEPTNSVRGIYGHPDRMRLHILIGNLILQASKHRDTILNLSTFKGDHESSFDWAKCLKWKTGIFPTVMLEKVKPHTDEHGQPVITMSDGDLPLILLHQSTVDRMPQSHSLVAQCAISPEVEIHQLAVRLKYGWEYVGPQTRLAVTPLTERAHLTLSTALGGLQIRGVIWCVGILRSCFSSNLYSLYPTGSYPLRW